MTTVTSYPRSCRECGNIYKTSVSSKGYCKECVELKKSVARLTQWKKENASEQRVS